MLVLRTLTWLSLLSQTSDWELQIAKSKILPSKGLSLKLGQAARASSAALNVHSHTNWNVWRGNGCTATIGDLCFGAGHVDSRSTGQQTSKTRLKCGPRKWTASSFQCWILFLWHARFVFVMPTAEIPGGMELKCRNLEPQCQEAQEAGGRIPTPALGHHPSGTESLNPEDSTNLVSPGDGPGGIMDNAGR